MECKSSWLSSVPRASLTLLFTGCAPSSCSTQHPVWLQRTVVPNNSPKSTVEDGMTLSVLHACIQCSSSQCYISGLRYFSSSCETRKGLYHIDQSLVLNNVFQTEKVLELKKFSNFKLDIDYSFSFLRKLPQWG